jgi:hypothetical protein
MDIAKSSYLRVAADLCGKNYIFRGKKCEVEQSGCSAEAYNACCCTHTLCRSVPVQGHLYFILTLDVRKLRN